ncbi:hypothetical protein GAP32_435 [Cronobacter phage vB_CsaM_GAP32]|uniref:Uncharacterized protein n=1 Tax=Cronobacter phage vB_CsaM_GAP32 TaxID=1141136 RepID=K4FB82_9CAUD|nr:hypothetical protein GAP32_435 [Cronobacter phage vB_CsaM_GAP32]AFC21889.1 hypothetical protein GAP32_435 [Cronobacter phage vB_CsaM_GAP32]
MDKYNRLYEIGEDHLISLMKIECPRSILGFSKHIVFNKNDSFTMTDWAIFFHLEDGINTFSVMIEPNNTFKALYYETEEEFDENYHFTFYNVPYDITEEWHFQLCTQKYMPFSFEFHTKLKEFIELCIKIM